MAPLSANSARARAPRRAPARSSLLPLLALAAAVALADPPPAPPPTPAPEPAQTAPAPAPPAAPEDAAAIPAPPAPAPEPAPALVRVCSPDRKFCAYSDPGEQRTFVVRRGASGALWSLPGWHRSIFLGDDGDHLVVGPDGGDTLPLDVRPEEPLLVFYKRNERLRIVRVGDLVGDVTKLPESGARYDWGHVRGVTAKNQLLVDLADGKRVTFDLATGASE